MLILTRKIDQSIIIQGDLSQGNITIMVLGVERDRVKIGIDAPAEVSVLRHELLDEAANNAPSPMRRRVVKLPTTQGNLALKQPTDE